MRRVDDWHRILDADGERLRPVHANAALRTQPSANIPQVGNGPAEFGAGVRKRPLAADRREDPEEVAERTAGWQPRRHGEDGEVVVATKFRQRPAGSDRNQSASELDPLGRRRQRFLRVSGVRYRHEEVLRPRVRWEAVVPDDLDRNLRAVGDPGREDVSRDRRAAHPDQEDTLGLVDREVRLRSQPHGRGDLVGERRDDVPHPSRIDLGHRPRLQHRRPHGTAQNKASAHPSENQ